MNQTNNNVGTTTSVPQSKPGDAMIFINQPVSNPNDAMQYVNNDQK